MGGNHFSLTRPTNAVPSLCGDVIHTTLYVKTRVTRAFYVAFLSVPTLKKTVCTVPTNPRTRAVKRSMMVYQYTDVGKATWLSKNLASIDAIAELEAIASSTSAVAVLLK